jgi:hypothetical protein
MDIPAVSGLYREGDDRSPCAGTFPGACADRRRPIWGNWNGRGIVPQASSTEMKKRHIDGADCMAERGDGASRGSTKKSSSPGNAKIDQTPIPFKDVPHGQEAKETASHRPENH